jgi:N-acetylmuramoyl-L-alanine amidase
MQTFKKYLLLLILVGINLDVNSAALQAIQVKNDNKEKTILFKMTGNFYYRAYSLHNPERLVVDIDNSNLASNLKNFSLEDETIKHVRYGHPTVNTLRIVFDLKHPVRFIAAKTRVNQTDSILLTLPLNHKLPDPVVRNQQIVKTIAPTVSKPQGPRPLRDVVVVIDPGHGGKDPGAIGINRSYEKHIVLAIAKNLKSMIDKQQGMRAVLTRNGDYYIGLRERMNIARKNNGDIFVAIHADAFGNHDSHGASVFALSARGATSEAARWLAEKENYSELGGVNLYNLDDKNGEIRTLLIDLSQTATINSSLNMGRTVLNNLDNITVLHSRKVEQAGFMVLKSPDIPSILIETGFISNPKEEKNLTSAYYQTKLSQAIFSGIRSYFWNFPPYGSLIEAMILKKRKLAGETKFFQRAS